MLSSGYLFADDIPVIVISPGKTVQSLGTVGSSVDVFTSETINESSHFSLAHIIDDNSTSTNLFQMGGYGSNIDSITWFREQIFDSLCRWSKNVRSLFIRWKFLFREYYEEWS